MKSILTVALMLFSTISAFANDSAVETSAGGLKLRKENSVLMKKERLSISRSLVRVEYEFRNTTNESAVSEVAFPIPPYKYVFDDMSRDFADFKAWIDGKPVNVEKEVRAIVNKRDVTDDLRQAGIKIETFGDYDASTGTDQFKGLKPDIRKKLVSIGIVKEHKDKKGKVVDHSPLWEVSIKYHWQQEFPPQTIVRVKHEYKPVSGYGGSDVKTFKKYFKDTCIDQKTYSELKRREADSYFNISWVSYILTTANTWQTPLEDFELIVDGKKGDLISFCWDGTVEKVGPEKLRAQVKNFIPKKELKVFFYSSFPK